MSVNWKERIKGRFHTMDPVPPPDATKATGDALNTLRAMNYAQKLIGIDTKTDPLLYQVFGHFREHPSFTTSNTRDKEHRDFAHTIKKPRDMTAFVAMLGDMHVIFRQKLTNSMKIDLDETALPPETQELISRFRANKKAWQAEMHSLLIAAKDKTGERHVSEKEIMENTTLQGLLHESAIICNGLTRSLDKDCKTVPLIVEGVKEEFPNNGMIGGGIFALHNASLNLANTYMVPPPISEYYTEHLKSDTSQYYQLNAGSKTDIPNGIRKILAGTVLAGRYDKALADQMPGITAAIEKGAHPLQMLHLLNGRKNIGSGSEEALHLLQLAKLPVYPERLESPAEMTLVLEALSGRHPTSEANKILALKDVDLTSAREKISALALLDALPPREGRSYENYQKQLALARAYLQPAQYREVVQKTQQEKGVWLPH